MFFSSLDTCMQGRNLKSLEPRITHNGCVREPAERIWGAIVVGLARRTIFSSVHRYG